jgi:hypothetical protein
MKKNIPIHKDDGKLRDLIIELLNTKKDVKKSKNLLVQVHNVINKESIIIQLRNEFNYIERLNKYYIKYLNKIKILVKDVLKNKKDVENLKQFLIDNYGDDVKVIDKYENKIKMMSMDTNDSTKINEEILQNKKKETKELQNKLNDIESKVSLNLKEIEKQKLILKKYEKQFEEEKEELMNKEKSQIIKISKIKQKFSYYDKQIKILKDKIRVFEQNNPMEKDVEIENEDIANLLLKKEDKECELNERIIENENLNVHVKTISSAISRLTLKLKELNENTNSHNTNNTTLIHNHTLDSKTSTKSKSRNSPKMIKNKRHIRI